MSKKATREKRDLRILCDKMWSQLIFKLFRGCCAWCGMENRPVDQHHIVRRNGKSIFAKYHPYMGLSLCSLPKKDGEISCHTYCDQNRDEVIAWLKTNLPTHYAFIMGVTDPEYKPPRITMNEIMVQLTRANAAYDLRPLPKIIPRCHLPPHMFKELVKRESGLIIPDKTVRPTGPILLP